MYASMKRGFGFRMATVLSSIFFQLGSELFGTRRSTRKRTLVREDCQVTVGSMYGRGWATTLVGAARAGALVVSVLRVVVSLAIGAVAVTGGADTFRPVTPASFTAATR